MLGLLIAVTQLVDWLERRDSDPLALSADFARVEVRRFELLREYLRREHRQPTPEQVDELDQRGTAMRMRIRTRASPARTLVVRWTVVDLRTGRKVPGDRWSRIAARLEARADAQEQVVPCFVPRPERPGRYAVVLTIETEDGRVVDRTKPIRL